MAKQRSGTALMISKRRWVYKLKTTRKFDTQFKKLGKKDKEATLELMKRLLNGERLDEKHKDHKLTGDLRLIESATYAQIYF